MAGGSIETTLELWASSLRDVKGRMQRFYRRYFGEAITFEDARLARLKDRR